MGELILIRHGQTSWNKEVIFRGRADIKLSSYGIKQAELLSERLKKIRVNFNKNQKEFSKDLCVAHGNYTRYETGKYNMRTDFLFSLYEYFNVNLHWLITGEGKMFCDGRDVEIVTDKDVKQCLLKKIDIMDTKKMMILMKFIEMEDIRNG